MRQRVQEKLATPKSQPAASDCLKLSPDPGAATRLESVPKDGEAARLRILRTAEKVFHERGVEPVSMTDIVAELKRGDRSAFSEEFQGNKQRLIDAVLARHLIPIQRFWFDALVASDSREAKNVHIPSALRSLTSLVVTPIVAKLDDRDGGQAFLAICAQVSSGTFYPLARNPACGGPVLVYLTKSMMELAGPMPMALMLLRKTRLESTLFQSIAQYVQLLERGLSVERDVFVADLVDTIAAIASPRYREQHLS